jgi:hypothetical protein
MDKGACLRVAKTGVHWSHVQMAGRNAMHPRAVRLAHPG